jgi:hypothetical protein
MRILMRSGDFKWTYERFWHCGKQVYLSEPLNRLCGMKSA